MNAPPRSSGIVICGNIGGVHNVEPLSKVTSLLQANPEGILPLVHAGDPVLRNDAARYEGQLGDLLADFLHALHVTMLDAPGVGVAAPQVGVPLAIAVMWDPGTENPQDPRERTAFEYRVIINPSYEPVGTEKVTFYEGCLSVPGFQAAVARYRTIRLRATDQHGNAIDEVLTGWPARIAQHETDHLYSTLYLDKAEIRSLCTTENLTELWSATADPADAARALRFDVAQQPAN